MVMTFLTIDLFANSMLKVAYSAVYLSMVQELCHELVTIDPTRNTYSGLQLKVPSADPYILPASR